MMFTARAGCPICGSRNAQTLYSSPFDREPVRSHILSHYEQQGAVSFAHLKGVEFEVAECRDCSLIYQRHVPNESMLRIIYEEFISPVRLRTMELKRLTLDSHWVIARNLALLFERLDSEPPGVRFLDYGFGYGAWARVAVGLGADVYATEISPDKIAFAKSIGVKIISDREIESQTFDIVHTEQVFEHLVNPIETFDRLAQCLSPSGIFKIAVPRQGRIRELLRVKGFIARSPFADGFSDRRVRDYNTILPLEHLNSYSPSAMRVLAARAGLRVENGPNGARFADIDFGSFGRLRKSSSLWAKRIAKETLNTIVPQLWDSGYYLLSRR